MLTKVLAGAGVLCAAVALWVDAGVERVPVHWLAASAAGVAVAAGVVVRHRAAGVLAALAAAGGAAFLLVVDLSSGVPGGATALLLTGAFAVLAAAAARFRAAGLAAAVLVAGGAGFLLASGLDSVAALLVVGAVAVAVASVVGDGGLPVAAVASVALVCAGVAVVGWVPATAVESTTAAAVGPESAIGPDSVVGEGSAVGSWPAPVADRPTGTPWRWVGGGEVMAVVAAGAGVAVAVDGGVISGLDGVTGEARWRYARPGAHVRALVATPDRSLVLAAFAAGGGRETGLDLHVVLDALTGEPLREWVGSDLRMTLSEPTDAVLPHRDGDRVVGVDLRTGAELWSWSAPPGCGLPFSLPASTGSVSLVAVECQDTVSAVALDARSGAVRWRRDAPAPARPDDSLLLAGRDAVAVRLPGQPFALLEADSGGEVTELRGRYPRVDAGARPVLVADGAAEVIDVATGTSAPVDPDDCSADATTATTYLRLCGAELRWQEYSGAAGQVRLPWNGIAAPTGLLIGPRQAVLVAAPGAVVAARDGDRAVLGYPGR